MQCTRYFLLFGLILTTSCASLRQVRFTVEPSALDYLQVVRTTQPDPDEEPVRTRIDLSGSGYLEVKTGRSKRVRSGFWPEPSSPDWEDIQRDHVILAPTETRSILQAFVDAGVFDWQKSPRKSDSPPELAILIAVGRRKTLLLTADPVYLQLFEDLQQKLD